MRRTSDVILGEVVSNSKEEMGINSQQEFGETPTGIIKEFPEGCLPRSQEGTGNKLQGHYQNHASKGHVVGPLGPLHPQRGGAAT